MMPRPDTNEPATAGMTVLRDGDKSRWGLVIAAGLAVFMASVDMSIVNIALPDIERDFGIGTSATEWVVLAYLLPLAGLALPTGRWLDTVGRRSALAFSVLGFAAASIMAGLAGTFVWLIVARLFQGAFGALLFSLVPALVMSAVTAKARGRAMGLITTLGPLGLISGPGVGGLLVDALGWQWIFFVNAPVSALVLMMGLRMLPIGRPLHRPDRAWVFETMLLSCAVASVLLSLTLMAAHGLLWGFLALIGLPFVYLWIRQPASGAVRELLAIKAVQRPHVALLAAATSLGIVFFITPFFLQRELNFSVADVGATVLAFPLGMALMGPLGGISADLLGSRRTAVSGAVLFTLGLLLLAPMDTSWSTGDVAWRLFIAGCGNGLFNAPNMTMAMSGAPQRLLATTGASTGLARTMGFALGPAIATLMWSLSSYEVTGIRMAIGVSCVLSAASVVALVSLGRAEAASRSR